jgi:O-antigen/teichoic acid export membrane protein
VNSLIKIVKESGINFSGTFIGKIFGYISLIIITRFLTPSDFGTFTLAVSIINICLIFILFGTPKALDRFIPYFNAVREFGKTKKLIRIVIQITIILSILVAIILFFISKTLAIELFNNTQLTLVLKILVIGVPFLTFIRVVSASFIGFKELRYQVYLDKISFPLMRILFALIVLFSGIGLLGWIWFYVLALFLVAFIAFIFFKNNILSKLSNINEQLISFKHIFNYSWPLSINSIILLLLVQINIIILGIFRPSSEVGVYRIYLSLIEFVILGMGSLAAIYKPVFTEFISKKDYDELRYIYRRISKWFVGITFLGSLCVFILGKELVIVFFTESYIIAPVALYILALCNAIISLAGPDFMTLEAFGNTKLLMINSIAMLFANVGLAYLLVPSFGIIGVALSTTIASIVYHSLGVYEVYKLHNLKPFGIFLFRYILTSCILGLIFYFIKTIIPVYNLFIVLSIVLFIVVIYFVIGYLLGGFDSTDLEILKFIRKKVILNVGSFLNKI